jgi:hypothetical protein
LLRKALNRELADFYGKLSDSELGISEISKSAFTQARKKLKAEAFIELSNEANKKFYEQAPYLKWGDHRVLACDGSTLQLPSSKDISSKFPTSSFGRNADKDRSLARVSLVYDVFNQITLNAKLGGFKTHETTLFKEQLAEITFMENDLILFDRGYPSFGLMFELIQKKIHFCMRLKDNWWNEVNAILEAGEEDKIVTFQLPKKDLKLAEKYGQKITEFKVRIVVLELENGQKEILCTSLLNPKECDLEDLEWLYHQRWAIEEAYKILKVRVNIENFSGLTALSIYQDFYASIFTMNLCAILAHPVQEKLKQEDEKNTTRKHKRKLNRTNAIAYVKNSLVVLLIKKKVDVFLKLFDDMLTKTTEIVRTDRHFERNHKPKKPKSMNYKDL